MPGDIVVGPLTYEAIKDVYRVAQLGFFALKGVSTQIPLYKLLGLLDSQELEAASQKQSAR